MTERTVIEQRTLALAGVAQAARIVDLAAKTGSWPTPFVEASIHSLFCFEPEAVDAVFGTPQGIRLGLEQLSACFELIAGRVCRSDAPLHAGHAAAREALCEARRPAEYRSHPAQTCRLQRR